MAEDGAAPSSCPKCGRANAVKPRGPAGEVACIFCGASPSAGAPAAPVRPPPAFVPVFAKPVERSRPWSVGLVCALYFFLGGCVLLKVLTATGNATAYEESSVADQQIISWATCALFLALGAGLWTGSPLAWWTAIVLTGLGILGYGFLLLAAQTGSMRFPHEAKVMMGLVLAVLAAVETLLVVRPTRAYFLA